MLFLACGFNLIIRFAAVKAGNKNPQFMGQLIGEPGINYIIAFHHGHLFSHLAGGCNFPSDWRIVHRINNSIQV